MPIQYILDYLKQNRDKFPLDILKKKLIEAGYPEREIEEAIKIIQKPKKIPTSFWDFRHKKIYISKKEKFLDFVFGFFVGLAIPLILNLLGGLLFYRTFGFSRIIFNLIFYLILIIYFFIIKRGYISIGIILSFPLQLLSILLFWLF